MLWSRCPQPPSVTKAPHTGKSFKSQATWLRPPENPPNPRDRGPTPGYNRNPRDWGQIKQKSHGPRPHPLEGSFIYQGPSPLTGKSQGARPHPPDETEIPRTQAPPTGWTRNPRYPGPSTGWNRNCRYPGSERSLVRLWVGTWENLSSPVRPRTTLDGGSV